MSTDSDYFVSFHYLAPRSGMTRTTCGHWHDTLSQAYVCQVENKPRNTLHTEVIKVSPFGEFAERGGEWIKINSTERRAA